MAMAAEGTVMDLYDEATCPVCLEYLKDPVIITECGHNFCQACLTHCWGELDTEASCPQCRITTRQKNFIPDWQLNSVVEMAKKLSLQVGNGTEVEEGVCERHQEPLELFCKDHENTICVVCEKCKEHGNHIVVPLEEASQEYKDEIGSRLEILRKRRENILMCKAGTEKESRDLLEKTKRERKRTVTEFQKLHLLLEQQEKLLLAQMEEVQKEIIMRKDQHLATLSTELSSLESLIQELADKHEQPASELLQDIRSTWERCKMVKTFEVPVSFPPALRLRIWDFSDINLFLERIMKTFADTLVSGIPLQKANIILDPDTANPWLTLTGDQKSLRWEIDAQDLPSNPERFDLSFCVLGFEGYTTGRHCWEVSVGSHSKGTWALGVARKSVRRKGDLILRPEEGFWTLWRHSAEYGASNSPDRPPLFRSRKLKTVRVSLNCAGLQLSFFDADTAVPLYTYSGAQFSGETLCPFFYTDGIGPLRLSW